MARYVDIDKPVIIPISDAVLGDIKYEQQVTLGELFEGLIDGPELEVVDAVPVVRCRDCRYWRREVDTHTHWVCTQHSFYERLMYTTPDFFCADGKR